MLYTPETHSHTDQHTAMGPYRTVEVVVGSRAISPKKIREAAVGWSHTTTQGGEECIPNVGTAAGCKPRCTYRFLIPAGTSSRESILSHARDDENDDDDDD